MIKRAETASLRDAAYGLLLDAHVGEHDPELERLCRRVTRVVAETSCRRLEEHVTAAERARIVSAWEAWREAAS
jgi:hypothetical protein